MFSGTLNPTQSIIWHCGFTDVVVQQRDVNILISVNAPLSRYIDSGAAGWGRIRRCSYVRTHLYAKLKSKFIDNSSAVVNVDVQCQLPVFRHLYERLSFTRQKTWILRLRTSTCDTVRKRDDISLWQAVFTLNILYTIVDICI